MADDYQRYLFDGKLLLAGFNPYEVTPFLVPELGGADIPRPEVKTIYPPLAEGLFAVAAWMGGTLFHWRIMNLLPDLLGAALLFKVLQQLKLSQWLILSWLWNPLIIMESLYAAHLDIWTLFAMLWFAYFVHEKRSRLAALSLGAAILIKLIPVLILPVWLTRINSSRDRAEVICITACTVIFGFIYFLPYHPFNNIIVFLHHIQGYGVLFSYLSLALGSEWAKLLLSSFAVALYLHVVFVLKRYQHQSAIQMFEIFVLFYIFSSMGFPWYLLLAIPLAIANCNLWLMIFIALNHINFYAHQLQQPSWIFAALILLALALALRKTRDTNHA